MGSELDKQHPGDDEPDARDDRPGERVTEEHGGKHRGHRGAQRTPNPIGDPDGYAGTQHHRQQDEGGDVAGDDHDEPRRMVDRCAQT
jgi:hypothetical protein